jgi:hypothetical protein
MAGFRKLGGESQGMVRHHAIALRHMPRHVVLGWLIAIAAVTLFGQGDTRTIKPVNAARKVALVIGNSAYHNGPLKNSANDARDVGARLSELGFDAEVVLNGGRKQMAEGIDRFLNKLRTGDVALFYYSGHGAQIDGENYLIPVDFEGQNETDVRYDTHAAGRIQERMERSGAQLNIIILDACRDNPYRSSSRNAGGGLAAMNAGRGTFVAFATSPGRTASDNSSGRNGLFTQYFLDALRQPGLALDDVFNVVREHVDEASGGKQLPWTQTAVVGRFTFVAGGSTPPLPRPNSNPNPNTDSRMESGPATLVVESDADATFMVDAQPGVALKAGQIRQITLSPGGHILQASAGGAGWRKVVEIRAGEQQAVVVELAKDIADAAIRRIEGTWALNWEGDGNFSAAGHRFHGKVDMTLQISRSGNDLTGVWHQTSDYKGIEDPKDPQFNYSTRIDARFRLKLNGDKLTGVPESAHEERSGGEKLDYKEVAFEGTLVNPNQLRLGIVWLRDAQGKELNTSQPTLERRQ